MTTHIPQISNVSAITNTVFAVKDGNLTTSAIAKVLGVNDRTVVYAADAARSFGLLSKSDTGWALTNQGRSFLANPISLTTFIANSPAVKAYAQGTEAFYALCERVGLSLTTAARRLSTVKAWFAFAGTVAPIQGRVGAKHIHRTVCPNCFIALPMLAKDSCDTCGTVL